LLVLLVGLMLAVLTVETVGAQTLDDEGTRPPPDETDFPDAGGDPDEQPAGSGDAAAEDDPVVNEDEPANDPVGEPAGPVLRELVDDVDRSIQIINVDDSGYPNVDVVLAVPPRLQATCRPPHLP
jgi:hypothetical protein